MVVDEVEERLFEEDEYLQTDSLRPEHNNHPYGNIRSFSIASIDILNASRMLRTLPADGHKQKAEWFRSRVCVKITRDEANGVPPPHRHHQTYSAPSRTHAPSPREYQKLLKLTFSMLPGCFGRFLPMGTNKRRKWFRSRVRGKFSMERSKTCLIVITKHTPNCHNHTPRGSARLRLREPIQGAVQRDRS
jgi:hypothetical protein